MKRLLHFVLTCLALFTGYTARSQSFADLLAQSEQIKTKYGETDDRYLDALSSTIQAAFREEKNVEANKYRLEHAEIVKQRYGATSLEYAEDLWRLGNVSAFKGEAYTFDCYQKAERIYANNNAKDSFPYSDIMWKHYIHYYNSNSWYLSLGYLKKYIAYASKWAGKDWKGNSYSDLDIAHAYLILGNLYKIHINDLSSSTEAYKESVRILENSNLVESYQFAEMPYMGIVLNFEGKYDPNEKLVWVKKYVDVIKLTKGESSRDYLNEYANLQYAYWEVGDLESIKKHSSNLKTLLQEEAKKKSIDVYSDTVYIKNQEMLESFCVAFQDYPGVIESAEELLTIYESVGRKYSPNYCSVLDDLILAYHNTQNDIAAYALFPEYERLCKTLNLTKTAEYCSYLGIKSEALTFLGRRTEFEEAIKELETLTEELYGRNSLNALLLYYSIANNYAQSEQYRETQRYIDRCSEILRSGECSFNTPKDSIIIAAGIHNVEGMIFTRTAPELAEQKLLLAIKELESADKRDYSEYVNLGRLYYERRRDFPKALEYFETAKSILEESGSLSSPQYLTVLNNIGLCYQELGQNSRAITIYDEGCKLAEEYYGKEHPIYAMSVQNKSNYLAVTGDYHAAIQCGNEALSCMGKIYGTDSEKYGLTLQNLANNYHAIGDNGQAESLFKQAIAIIEHIGSGVYLLYGYSNLLNVYSVQNRWEEFDDIAKRCEDILANSTLGDSDLRATVDVSLGYAALTRGKPEAKIYFDRATKLMEESKGASSLEYLYCLLYYEAACQYQNEELIPQFVEHYKDLYSNDIAYMNAEERENLITGRFFAPVKNILFSSRHSNNYDESLYNYLLFSKGLLLGTAQNYAKAVYHSKDASLIAKYTELLNLNKFLRGEAHNLSKSYTQEEAKEKSTSLERDIIIDLRNNQDFRQDSYSTFKDVYNSLERDEAAIEFVDYLDFNNNTRYYAALVARRDGKSPSFVRLCEQSEIEHFLSLQPDQLYGETPMSAELCSLIWEPLKTQLRSIRKIFFSPSGVLHQLAIEHLYDGKKYFDSQYDVIRVSSTKEVKGKHSSNKYSSAVLYGGLQYDEDDEIMIAESRKIRGPLTLSPTQSRGIQYGAGRRGWKYLPGTLEEVNSIAAIISSGGIASSLFTAERGNEESFKTLSGQNFNLLHIATHGFYIPASQVKKNDFLSSNPFALQTDKIESSLARTGLLLSGGNKAWLGKTVPEGVEDGVLTAAEVADMDLNRCDVVILSACETGLGEITDEGVFGLQRAFKNAGVDTIIMSLWEVDDQATSLMMQTFYSNLVKGKSKRESFKIAQDEVRKKYSDPRYWAAFIMLD